MTEIDSKTKQGLAEDEQGPAEAEKGHAATAENTPADIDQSRKFTPSLSIRLAGFVAPLVLFLVLDRLTKNLILAALSHGAFAVKLLPGIIRLQFVANTGAAFSIGEGHGYVFVALAVLVVAAMCAYLMLAERLSALELVGLGMVAGGAIGNAIDRVVYGFVVDFFATEFIDFPIFNVADIGITVGVVLAFAGFMLTGARASKEEGEVHGGSHGEARGADGTVPETPGGDDAVHSAQGEDSVQGDSHHG